MTSNPFVWYYDIFMAMAVFILLACGFFMWGIPKFYRSPLRRSFKILAGLLLAGCLLYVVIFSAMLYHVVFATSFMYHIRDGDLISHLERAF